MTLNTETRLQMKRDEVAEINNKRLQCYAEIRDLEELLRRERLDNIASRRVAKAQKNAARNARTAKQIAATEAKLEKLRQRAMRRSGLVRQATPEEIAAMNRAMNIPEPAPVAPAPAPVQQSISAPMPSPFSPDIYII